LPLRSIGGGYGVGETLHRVLVARSQLAGKWAVSREIILEDYTTGVRLPAVGL